MFGDGTICPGTERYVQGRKDMSRDGTSDGTICSGMERGTEKNGTRGGTERYGTKSVKIPMRTLYFYSLFFLCNFLIAIESIDNNILNLQGYYPNNTYIAFIVFIRD